MRYIAAAAVVLATMQGCAGQTTATQRAAPEPAPEPVRYSIDRRASATHLDTRLGGAAYRASGYRHVLRYGELRYTRRDTRMAVVDGSALGAAAGDASAETSGSDGTGMTSEAARARELWERYCDSGVSMTNEELAELDEFASKHPMPAELASSCSPPK